MILKHDGINPSRPAGLFTTKANNGTLTMTQVNTHEVHTSDSSLLFLLPKMHCSLCHFLLVYFLSLARWKVRLHSHVIRVHCDISLFSKAEFAYLICTRNQLCPCTSPIEEYYPRKQTLGCKPFL